jgi:hypothetical protein
MPTKVHPAPNHAPDPLGSIVAGLASMEATSDETFLHLLNSNPAAKATLKRLGYIKASEQQAHGEAKLPPELEQFVILKEIPKVAAALNEPAFLAAQEALQATPNDATALATLQQCVQPVVAIYKDAIEARVQEDGIKTTCHKVIEVGNGDFEAVYQTVWDMTAHSDKAGVEQYTQALKAVVVPKKPIRQQNNDACVLY